MNLVNAVSINEVFSGETISRMHASYVRLMQCAMQATSKLPAHLRITKPGHLAKRLGQTPQVVHNWTKRGVSLEGAAAAELEFGCSVAYIRDGVGLPPNWMELQHADQGATSALVAQDVSQPGFYSRLNVRVDVPVLRTARASAQGVLDVAQNHQAGSVATVGVSRDTFAVRIEGDELFPAVRHSMFVLCDPSAPCTPGEWIYIETTDGQTHLRELLIDQGSEITTSSVLGGHRRTFSRREVRRAVAVVGTAFASRFKPI